MESEDLQHAQLLADMNRLMRACLEGARRRDPPDAWTERLERLSELKRRLDSLEA
jgi:hypothetical protein